MVAAHEPLAGAPPVIEPPAPTRPAADLAPLGGFLDPAADLLTDLALGAVERMLTAIRDVHLQGLRAQIGVDPAELEDARSRCGTGLIDAVLASCHAAVAADPARGARWRALRAERDRVAEMVAIVDPPSATPLAPHEVAAIAASLELARVLLAEGRRRLRGDGRDADPVRIRRCVDDPLEHAGVHVAHAARMAGAGPRAAAPSARTRLAHALGPLAVEVARFQDDAGAELDATDLDGRLSDAIASLGEQLDVADAAPIRGRPLDRKAAVGAALAACRDGVAAGVAALLRSPSQTIGPTADKLYEQVGYALLALGALDVAGRAGTRRDVAALVAHLDPALERLGLEGHPLAMDLFLLASSLGGMVGLDPPAFHPIVSPRATDASRAEAYAALQRFDDAAERSIDHQRDWQLVNWAFYLKYTSQNPALPWLPDKLLAFCGNLAGSLVTEASEKTLEAIGRKGGAAIGAAIGTVALPGVGTAIGFLVGVAIETLIGCVLDAIAGGTDADQAASDATLRMGDQITDLASVVGEGAERATTRAHHIRDRLTAALEKTDSQDQVDEVLRWADLEASVVPTQPPTSDLSLGRSLLRDWVLQQAADEDDANDGTNPTSWERARKQVGLAEDLDQPDLFVHQTIGHLRAIGVSETDITIAAATMTSTLPTTDGPLAHSRAAETIRAAHGLPLVLTGIAPKLGRTIAELGDGTLLPVGAAAVDREQLVVRIVLDLERDGSSVYVDEWEYDLRLTDRTMGLLRPNLIPTHHLQFEVSPD